MGWPEERVLIIDDDLGISGASSEGRAGFRRLVSEVSLNHVGLILGVEMSRLARSSKDWHQLLEICAIFGTLISDLDGVYDPSQYNDRLLLGLKGTMSEAELHILKQRMHQGKLSKARRGELALPVPTGYVRQPSGEVIFDPDEEVQRVVRLIFRKFEELGTLHGVLAYLVEHGVKLGIRVRQGEAKGARMAPPQPDDAAEFAQTPHLRWSLRWWPSPGGSPQEEARPPFHRAHGGASREVARPHQGPLAGLHLLGALREKPGAPRRKPGAGGRHGRIPRGTFAASGSVGLRQVRSSRDGPLRWKPQPA